VRGTGCAVSLRDLRVSAQSHFPNVAQGGRNCRFGFGGGRDGGESGELTEATELSAAL
jgi:hypothetical protein